MIADLVTDMRSFLPIFTLDNVANNPIILGFKTNQCIVSIFKRLSFEDDIIATVKQYNTVEAATKQFSCIHEKNMMTLTFLVFDQMRRQLNLDVNELDDNALEAKQYKEQKEKVKKDGATMDKIETRLKLHDWDAKFENFLAAKVGCDGMPLDYIVQHKKLVEWDSRHDAENEYKMLHYLVCLQGPIFDNDSKTIYQIFKEAVFGDMALQGIRALDKNTDGRLAMETLRAHV